MKTCSKCGKEKALHEFPTVKPRGKYARPFSWCKECKYFQQSESRRRKLDEYKEKCRKYYQAHKERHYENTYRWKQSNPEKVKDTNRRYFSSLRDKVFDHYGRRCSCECGCREKPYKFLTIDHISGGGNRHLKSIGQNLYKWLIDNGFPTGFRTLCFDCNMGRQVNSGVCPAIEGSTTIPEGSTGKCPEAREASLEAKI
jgi:hypothetical protein